MRDHKELGFTMVFISVLLQYLGVSCSSFGLLEDLEKKTIKNEKNKTNPWCSELPDDIIELILRRLDVLDYIRFYSVCKLWRSVAVGMDLGYSLCCRGLPWLMFTCDAKTQTYGFFSLSESRKYYIPLPTAGGLAHCCGSSQGWLLMCNSASGGCFLLNPFSGAEIKLPRLSPPLAYKVILSNPPVSDNTNDFMVVAMNATHLVFCRLGDLKWTLLHQPESSYSDAIYHKGKLYAVNRKDELWVFQLQGPRSPSARKLKIPPVDLDPRPLGRSDTEMMTRYLVEPKEKLLLVYGFFHLIRTHGYDSTQTHRPCYCDCGCDSPHNFIFQPQLCVKFKIYVLDEDNISSGSGEGGYQWNVQESLGNQALFLGRNTSKSLSATEFLGLKENCIYFTLNFYKKSFDEFHYSGIYHVENGMVESCFPFDPDTDMGPPIWITPSNSI